MKQILAMSSWPSPNIVDKESKTQRRVLLKVTQVSNDSYAYLSLQSSISSTTSSWT